MEFILLNILLVFIGILLITFLLWPVALIRFGRRAVQKIDGVQVRYAEHNGYRFCYFSRGKPGLQPSILMLHGFTFDKDMWLGSIYFFPKNIHVVCLDLPGHGKTSRLTGDSFATSDQVKRVHQFVECIGLNGKPFHLVGISMGGMIAGVYAAQYPSEVCCLSLLCPIGQQLTTESINLFPEKTFFLKKVNHVMATSYKGYVCHDALKGLQFPTDTDIMKRVKEDRKNHDKCPLIPSNTQQGLELFRTCVYSTYIPEQLVKGFLKDWLAENNFFRKCFFDIFNDESWYSLQNNMSQIRAPTQVIWGKEDKVVDQSGAEVLAKGIPNSQLYLLEKCGHFIPIDYPKKLSRLILDFHTSYMK